MTDPYDHDRREPSEFAIPLLLTLPRVDLVDALTAHADLLEQRARNLNPSARDPHEQRHLLAARVGRLRAAALVMSSTPDHRTVTDLSNADLVAEIGHHAATPLGGRLDGEQVAATVPLAVLAKEAAARLAAQDEPVDFHDAVALAEIVRAAQGRKLIRRHPEDGPITTARAGGIEAIEGHDIRDTTLQVTRHDTGEVEHWPIRDLLAEYHRGEIDPDYEPAGGAP